MAVFGAAYVVCVALLYANRVREFGDETDNLLGGLLMARGGRLYVDFFSSHMPLPYDLAALAARLGATSLGQFRLFTLSLLVLATVSISWAFWKRLGYRVMLLWAMTTVFAHRLQFGEMLTASTVAGYGVALAGLVFFARPNGALSWREKALLSLGVFIALESELVAVFPVVLLGLAYSAVRLRSGPLSCSVRDIVLTGVLVTVPHLALLGVISAQGELAQFIDQAVSYNQLYYSQFVMNPSIAGMLHDWEAQYRTYLLQSVGIGAPPGVHTILVVGNIVAAVLVGARRGIAWGVGYWLFIGLCHVRNEGAYYLCSYFSLALLLDAAFDTPGALPRRRLAPVPVLGAAAALLLIAPFTLLVARTYDFSGRPPRYVPEVRAITALTAPTDTLFVVPFDPYVYLAAERRPASIYTYFLPWHVVSPSIVARLNSDLLANRPAAVVFRGDEPVNDRYYAREYASDLYAFLLAQGYAPLGERDLFGDVLMRADLVDTARARVEEDVNLRAAARAEQQSWVPQVPTP